MIPEKNLYYKIQYIDLINSSFNYFGTGRYTGKTFNHNSEELYEFDNLESEPGFTSNGFFGEENIFSKS